MSLSVSWLYYLLYEPDDFFQPVSVSFCESAELFAVDVQNCHYMSITPYRHHDLASGFAAACDMSRKRLYIRHDYSFTLFPCTSTHAPAICDSGTCGRTLKRTEYQLMASIKKVFDPEGILNPGKVCYPVEGVD